MDYVELDSESIPLPRGLEVGDVVYFNVTILNDNSVEELMEVFSVHFNGTDRVVAVNSLYASVVIVEDLSDSK